MRNIEVVELLLDKGAKVSAVDRVRVESAVWKVVGRLTCSSVDLGREAGGVCAGRGCLLGTPVWDFDASFLAVPMACEQRAGSGRG